MTNRKEPVFSCSMLDCFSQCRRKCYYSYMKNLEPRKRNWNLLGGSMIHRAMEALYNGELPAKALQAAVAAGKDASSGSFMSVEDEFERDKFIAMANGYTASYHSHYAKEADWTTHTVESKFEDIRIEGFLFQGIIDLIVANEKGKLAVMDHKTTSWLKDDFLAALPLQFQTVVYPTVASIIAGKPITVMYYNMLKKTSLRQGKKETVAQYFVRVAKDIAENPANYYYREKVNLNDKLQTRLLTNIREMCKELTSLVEADRLCKWYRSPKACCQFGRACEFMPICLKGEKTDIMLNYQEKSDTHGYLR